MISGSTDSDYRAESDAAVPIRPHVFVAMTCDNALEPPSRHALADVNEVCIGRGSRRAAVRHAEAGRNHLTLTLADSCVSSAHARICRRDGEWHVEDLGSKNGTFVNGSGISVASLSDGDCLQVGHTLLIFRAALPTPANAPADLEATARVPALATLIPGLARELDLLAVAATSKVPVLLVSETGTGKELVARALHALSRRKGAFVPINCGGLAATLVESLLFGHKRGAFSGALGDEPGLFRAADGGTLLLDEIGDMPLAAQASILRTLQDGEVLSLGATRAVHIDARIIAATHRDLEGCVVDGTFREDLLSRLSGFTFRLPPLRERREDIGLLAGILLRASAREWDCKPALSPEAGTALLRHTWPRNVREFEKCLAHCSALARGGRIEVEHLPEGMRAPDLRPAPQSDEALRGKLVALLRQGKGNVSFAANALRTSRSQVHRWMKRFQIDAACFRN